MGSPENEKQVGCIQDIRRRKGREDWEIKLEPPVNRGLPVKTRAGNALPSAIRDLITEVVAYSAST